MNRSGYRYFLFTSEDAIRSNFLNIIKQTKSAGPTDSIMKTSQSYTSKLWNVYQPQLPKPKGTSASEHKVTYLNTNLET